ncbi:MAG: hypothetical protein WC979_06735 [Candidatus Pacearchaeota archaeon]|jgi:hypothetical protein
MTSNKFILTLVVLSILTLFIFAIFVSASSSSSLNTKSLNEKKETIVVGDKQPFDKQDLFPSSSGVDSAIKQKTEISLENAIITKQNGEIKITTKTDFNMEGKIKYSDDNGNPKTIDQPKYNFNEIEPGGTLTFNENGELIEAKFKVKGKYDFNSEIKKSSEGIKDLGKPKNSGIGVCSTTQCNSESEQLAGNNIANNPFAVAEAQEELPPFREDNINYVSYQMYNNEFQISKGSEVDFKGSEVTIKPVEGSSIYFPFETGHSESVVDLSVKYTPSGYFELANSGITFSGEALYYESKNPVSGSEEVYFQGKAAINGIDLESQNLFLRFSSPSTVSPDGEVLDSSPIAGDTLFFRDSATGKDSNGKETYIPFSEIDFNLAPSSQVNLKFNPGNPVFEMPKESNYNLAVEYKPSGKTDNSFPNTRTLTFTGGTYLYDSLGNDPSISFDPRSEITIKNGDNSYSAKLKSPGEMELYENPNSESSDGKTYDFYPIKTISAAEKRIEYLDGGKIMISSGTRYHYIENNKNIRVISTKGETVPNLDKFIEPPILNNRGSIHESPNDGEAPQACPLGRPC